MAKKRNSRKAKRKAKQNKQNRLKAVKPQKQSKPPRNIQFLERVSFSEMEAPDGFRPISISQAMMEYAKPLMELAERGDIDDEKVFQIASALWNYTILLGDGKKDEDMRINIYRLIECTYGMSGEESSGLIEKMIQRKNHLFPPDIQPEYPMTLFIRKEVSHLIAEFDYSKIDLSGETIPPDKKDRELIKSITRMDQYIIDGADYDEWEDHYFSMEEECADRFHKWLNDKGLSEYSEDFPYWTETYLNFVYNYMHDDIVLLKKVSSRYIEEFFADYVLRKIMVEPYEYAQFIPAIKLFYTFLQEKGYLDDPKPIVELIDAFEPHFIEILRKRFG